MANCGVAMAPPSHHSHQEGHSRNPVQDWETPGSSRHPEVSWLPQAIHLLFKKPLHSHFTTAQ